MRARTLALTACLLWIFALAGLAHAQARVEERGNLAVTGDITAIDAGKRQITVKSTSDEGLVYQVDGAATIMAGSEKRAFSDLEVGWNVAMNGHRTGDTRLVTFIKVVKAP